MRAMSRALRCSFSSLGAGCARKCPTTRESGRRCTIIDVRRLRVEFMRFESSLSSSRVYCNVMCCMVQRGNIKVGTAKHRRAVHATGRGMLHVAMRNNALQAPHLFESTRPRLRQLLGLTREC